MLINGRDGGEIGLVSRARILPCLTKKNYDTACSVNRHCLKLTDNAIGHFRVPPGLCIKTRLGAQPFLWK